MIASRLLWRAAGRPEWGDAAEPCSGPCWWCGAPTDGIGRPVRTLPDTWPALPGPAVPSASHLCGGCSWSVSDRIRLPGDAEEAKTAARCEAGGRLNLERGRRLALRLADGRVGLWVSRGNAASEEPWLAAREALRVEPADVGAIALEEIVSPSSLAPAPKEKFRNYHHIGEDRPGTWRPYTNADRAAIRAVLLDPPAGPWCCVIGDGQKHAAIHAPVSPGAVAVGQVALFGAAVRPTTPPQLVYVDGAVVAYHPEALAAQVAAVEALIAAGASDDEVSTGAYRPRGLTLHLAIREHDARIAPLRGGPVFGLLLFLRRTRKQMEEAA